MRDSEFYRFMISKRVAIKALVEINKALNNNHCYFYNTDGISEGSYDSAVYSMASNIKDLVNEIKEYRELKRILNLIIKI